MMNDIPAFLFGMALGFPIYLLIDRLVYPFGGWLRYERHGGE